MIFNFAVQIVLNFTTCESNNNSDVKWRSTVWKDGLKNRQKNSYNPFSFHDVDCNV